MYVMVVYTGVCIQWICSGTTIKCLRDPCDISCSTSLRGVMVCIWVCRACRYGWVCSGMIITKCLLDSCNICSTSSRGMTVNIVYGYVDECLSMGKQWLKE